MAPRDSTNMFRNGWLKVSFTTMNSKFEHRTVVGGNRQGTAEGLVEDTQVRVQVESRGGILCNQTHPRGVRHGQEVRQHGREMAMKAYIYNGFMATRYEQIQAQPRRCPVMDSSNEAKLAIRLRRYV